MHRKMVWYIEFINVIHQIKCLIRKSQLQFVFFGCRIICDRIYALLSTSIWKAISDERAYKIRKCIVRCALMSIKITLHISFHVWWVRKKRRKFHHLNFALNRSICFEAIQNEELFVYHSVSFWSPARYFTI